jgi:PhoD-like phosphatase
VSQHEVNRRRFIRVVGRSLVAAGALSACDLGSSPGEASTALFFSEEWARAGEGWGPEWLKARYDTACSSSHGSGLVELATARKKGVEKSTHSSYLGEPIVLGDFEVTDARAEVRVTFEGRAEAGLLLRWSYDEAYALLVSDREILLCRYDVKTRHILDRREAEAPGPWHLALAVRGGLVVGDAEGSTASHRLTAEDPNPLPSGYVGVVVNATDIERPARVRFASFRAKSNDVRPPSPRFAYRFTGAAAASGDSADVRVTARTVSPREIAFEVADNEDFRAASRTGWTAPRGRLGAVHGHLEGLTPQSLYHWRPVTKDGDVNVAGPAARFRTPALPGSAVRFAFGSCTSGRTDSYPSFITAASFDPEFYLHAGDWAYADLNSQAHRPDHFQARWTRLLRIDETSELLSKTGLVFWQDDHDYQADNGWAETVKPYTVTAFDELHANPAPDYFDIRWGDAHIWCLDCRLFATDPQAPDGPAKSRIGSVQKQWLKQGMTGSDASVQIVASPMAFRNKVDEDPGWHNAYTFERDELLSFFSSLPSTVVILSGDSHGHRLIHHFEFGALYEITASGTDFPSSFGQGNNDPAHTLVNITDRTGFAIVDLDAAGSGRRITVRSIASKDGSTMFDKSLPVR